MCTDKSPKAFVLSVGIQKLPITWLSVDNFDNRVLCYKPTSINHNIHGCFLCRYRATGWFWWISGLRAVAMWSSSSFTKMECWVSGWVGESEVSRGVSRGWVVGVSRGWVGEWVSGGRSLDGFLDEFGVGEIEWVSEPVSESVSESVRDQWVGEWVSQSVSQSMSESVRESVRDQWVSEWVSEYEWVSEWTSGSVSESLSQSVNQSGKEGGVNAWASRLVSEWMREGGMG